MRQSGSVSDAGLSESPRGPFLLNEAAQWIDAHGLWPEVETQSRMGPRPPRLSAPLDAICRSLLWSDHRRVAVEWFYIATLIMWLTIPLDYLVAPEAISTVLLGHGLFSTVALVIALRAWASFGSNVWQGLSTCLFVGAIMAAAILTGQAAGGAHFERFVVIGFFGMSTGVAFLPLTTLWTVLASLVLVLSFLAGQILNPLVDLASGLLFTCYCIAIGSAFVWYRWRSTGNQLRVALLRMKEAHNAGLLKESHDRLHFIAHTDALTGLCNREAVMEALALHLREAPADSVLSVAMIDIDDFKRLNDSLGHIAGDQALRSVGTLFLDFETSDNARCGRIGGEEFLILLPGIGAELAHARIATLMGRLHQMAIAHPQSTVSDRVTLSVGIVTTTLGTNNRCELEALVRTADIALYAAKKEGRNRIVSVALGPERMAA